MKFTDRISLKKMFELSIFEASNRMDVGQHFLTASKIFKMKGLSSLQLNMKSKQFGKLSAESQITGALIKNKDSRIEVRQVNEDKSYEWNAKEGELKREMHKCLFLKAADRYLVHLSSSLEDKAVIEYIYLTLAKINL